MAGTEHGRESRNGGLDKLDQRNGGETRERVTRTTTTDTELSRWPVTWGWRRRHARVRDGGVDAPVTHLRRACKFERRPNALDPHVRPTR